MRRYVLYRVPVLVYLEVPAVLRGVLEGPQSPHEPRQLLRDLSFGQGTLLLQMHSVHLRSAPLLLLLIPLFLALVVLQDEVLGEELRVAETLQHRVHEAGVPVVLEAGHSGHPVPGQEAREVPVVHVFAPGLKSGEAAIVFLVLRLHFGSKVGQRRQGPEEAAHEAAHGAHGAAAEELLAEAGLLVLGRRFARHGSPFHGRLQLKTCSCCEEDKEEEGEEEEE